MRQNEDISERNRLRKGCLSGDSKEEMKINSVNKNFNRAKDRV